jgi:hypothetical protein
MPPTDSPTNMSAPSIASASVVASTSLANSAFSSLSSSRSGLITPAESTITMFSRRAPRET